MLTNVLKNIAFKLNLTAEPTKQSLEKAVFFGCKVSALFTIINKNEHKAIRIISAAGLFLPYDHPAYKVVTCINSYGFLLANNKTEALSHRLLAGFLTIPIAFTAPQKEDTSDDTTIVSSKVPESAIPDHIKNTVKDAVIPVVNDWFIGLAEHGTTKQLFLDKSNSAFIDVKTLVASQGITTIKVHAYQVRDILQKEVDVQYLAKFHSLPLTLVEAIRKYHDYNSLYLD